MSRLLSSLFLSDASDMQRISSTAAIWSATPTPFNEDLSVDRHSIVNLVEHHVRMGVSGLMLAGTCGEGPWMTWEDIEILVQQVVEENQGRLRIAVQVTDNSPRRVLRNIDRMVKAGAEFAVVAAPAFMLNATPQRILEFYQTIVRESGLPVGFYDLGKHRAYALRVEDLEELLSEPNLVLVKDSTADPMRRAVYVEAARRRENLRIFNGDEFDCVTPLREGYDGLLLGGSIFNAAIATRITEAVAREDGSAAAKEQAFMNEVMYQVYGGRKIECWMSGLKYLLQRMEVFKTTASHLEYPLYDEYRNAIDTLVQQGVVMGKSRVEV